MKIAVLANNEQWEELKPVSAQGEWLPFFDEQEFFRTTQADIYINLLENASEKDYTIMTKPVLINSVPTTLREMKATNNMLRTNGWKGFITGSNWEVAGEMNGIMSNFFSLINKRYTIVADQPGLVTARIIAMIINEAYFALEEKISTKEEIDVAMRLGTNYPFGPFEWSKKIGIKNIYNLLQKLSTGDDRYSPASLLQQEARQ